MQTISIVNVQNQTNSFRGHLGPKISAFIVWHRRTLSLLGNVCRQEKNKEVVAKSLQSGKLPADWCRAFVTPIFKKGDKSSAANYRPISLTCILCNVLEHIIASQLVKHMNSHGLLYELQHGFRENPSCETQLIMLVEELARNASAGKQTDLVLLDFFKGI